MKIIAHRGLFVGPNTQLENSPAQIQKALVLGYDCEIDLWAKEGNLYLGHDYPQYPIYADFLLNEKFWIHAKNLDALFWLSSYQNTLNYFWHESDQFTLTSQQYIWTCDAKNLTDRSVLVILGKPTTDDYALKCYGICCDFGNDVT